MSVESNPGLHWVCFTTFCDWSRKLAPLSQPVRCKTNSNRDLVTHVFPRLKPVRDCAIITWKGAGGWESRGGHRGKSYIERVGLDVKFNIYWRGITFFHSFSQTRKVVEELCSYPGVHICLDWN